MKVIVFEGTAEELKIAAPHIFPNGTPKKPDVLISESEQDNQEIKGAYRAILTRIEIQEGQLDLYRVLSKGELEYGEYLKRMGRTAQEIAGVHGALGRRINKTPEIHKVGLPGGCGAIMLWRKDKGKDFLSLKPEFIEVLEEEGII